MVATAGDSDAMRIDGLLCGPRFGARRINSAGGRNAHGGPGSANRGAGRRGSHRRSTRTGARRGSVGARRALRPSLVAPAALGGPAVATVGPVWDGYGRPRAGNDVDTLPEPRGL